MLDIPWLEPTIANVNAVLKGEKTLQVDAKIPTKDALMLGGIIFIAMFGAVLLANAVFKR